MGQATHAHHEISELINMREKKRFLVRDGINQEYTDTHSPAFTSVGFQYDGKGKIFKEALEFRDGCDNVCSMYVRLSKPKLKISFSKIPHLAKCLQNVFKCLNACLINALCMFVKCLLNVC